MNKNNIKDYSRKISERMWNLPDKGELESHREETYIDDIIQKSHIERKLLDNLEGIDTVFDAGAGSGRFSILLAKHGCRVTHFDISQPMIDKAKELSEQAGVIDRITFVKGALEDLSDYTNKSYDMVYLYCSVSPIPFATMTNREWGQIGNNYLKALFAIGFQGFLIMVCVGIYAVLVNNITVADNLHSAIFSLAAYTVILCFSLFKSGALAKSIFSAH